MTARVGAARRVLVVGSGVAGASAALAAAGLGADVLVVAAGGTEGMATARAQGGIAAAIGPGDSPRRHAADTLAAGAGLADPGAVEVLTREGAERVRALLASGFPADRGRDGRVALGLEAAHGRHRIVHAGGDRTGAVLAAWCRDRLDAARVETRQGRLVELLVRGGAVTGAIVEEAEGTLRAIEADAVVLATGGLGGLYPVTTAPGAGRGEGMLAAWDAGAQLADLELVQFHPTALARPGAFLVSEAVRGAGAVLLDGAGRRFLLDDDPRGELAPRDVVAAGVARAMRAQGGAPVLLDATPIVRAEGRDALARRFPGIDAALREHGIDWTREPVPVAPAAHFAMGGIRTDLDGRSSVPGLLAAGECARVGVHGANRLASNSLLEGLVFGARAGAAAAGAEAGPPSWPAETLAESARPGAPVAATLDRVREAVGAGVGIERDADGLAGASAALGGMAADATAAPEAHRAARLGRLLAESALRREESRGAHRRRDRPGADPRAAVPTAIVRGPAVAAPPGPARLAAVPARSAASC